MPAPPAPAGVWGDGVPPPGVTNTSRGTHAGVWCRLGVRVEPVLPESPAEALDACTGAHCCLQGTSCAVQSCSLIAGGRGGCG